MPGNLLVASVTTNKCYRLSGFSSTISDSFTKTRSFCVAWDGTDVLYGGDNPSSKIWKGTGFTATVQNSFAWSPGAGAAAYDIDWDGTNLRSVNADTKAYLHSGFSATITSSINMAGKNFRGCAWDGTNLMTLDSTGKFIRQHTGFSTSITSSFDISGYAFSSPRGLSWDGTNLYHSNSDNSKQRKYNGFSSTITDSFTAPGADDFGIDWDGYPAPPATATAAVQQRSPTGGVIQGGGGMIL